jgi:hypothetical protein
MTHPNKYLLLELDIAIKKIPPTLSNLKTEAQARLKAFESDETTSEDSILGYLAELGRQEFPHRHALVELHKQYGKDVEDKMVIEHLDEAVAKKVQTMLDSGVVLEELINSDWFEDKLDAAERYQVEDGILLARYKIEQEDGGLIAAHKDDFDKLVSKWESEAQKIEALLEKLEALAGKDERYKDEIKEQVKQFKSGWSIVERDPSSEEIKGTIDYWEGIFEDEAEAGSAK